MAKPWAELTDVEKSALLESVDDQAEVFLTACVQYARLCQQKIEQGRALDLLTKATERMLQLLQYHEQQFAEMNDYYQTNEPKPLGKRGGVT